MKLLTARVLRLEQEMARHKKVSVIMVGEKEKDGSNDAAAEDDKNDEGADAENGEEAEAKSPEKSPAAFKFFE